MFYCHEVLTSREHGVATVWLVATLGSKSSLKKVGRRDILQVDVSKACRTITTPTAPMALRLQSSLLYGVSRVFSEQCSYVLGDAQTATNNMRQLLRTVRAAQLDMATNKTSRPEHLLLADDPAFDPAQALDDIDFDLSIPGLVSDSASQGYLSSPHTPGMGRGVPELIIPSSASNHGGLFGSFASSSFPGSKIDGLSGFRQGSLNLGSNEDDGFLPDADFTIDADGNIIEPPLLQSSRSEIGLPDGSELPRLASQSGNSVSARHSGQIEEGFMAVFDDELPDLIPDDPRNNDDGQPRPYHGSSVVKTSSQEGSEYAEARLTRRSRQAKPFQRDRGPLEVRTADISAWGTNYLTNMRAATEQKLKARVAGLAKKNATYLVWTTGIGDIGQTARLRTFRGNKDPLDIFYGDKLYNWAFGIDNASLTSNPRKRHGAHQSTDGSSEDGRRVRHRSASAEAGRGGNALDDEQLGALDQDEDEVERGRDAPTPLHGGQDYDISSTMPWNMSGSARLSSTRNQPRAGSRSSATPMPFGRQAQFARAGSRTRSVSPMPSLGGLGGLTSGNSDDFLHGAGGGGGGASDGGGVSRGEFERFGRAAFVDTQTAEQSQFLRETLDHESDNFIGFVEQAIATRNEMTGGAVGGMAFAELLSPLENTHIVAAQALLHSLTLASKGLLGLEQAEHFGEIMLTPAVSVQA